MDEKKGKDIKEKVTEQIGKMADTTKKTIKEKTEQASDKAQEQIDKAKAGLRKKLE